MNVVEQTVVVTDHPWPSVATEQRILASVGAKMVFASSGDQSELVELAADADAILTCFARVTPEVIRAGERLRTIARYGIGVDNIAVAEATARGIIVSNTPSYCEHEVAEHTIAMLMALARRLTVFDHAVRGGDWSLLSGQPVLRVAGQSLGILGFGNIGRAVARRARALELAVLAYHPRLTPVQIESHGAEPVSLVELAERSDFLSLHIPLLPQTRHIVDRSLLRRMRANAYLINTARAEIVDQVALVEALRRRAIAGAALDVVTPYPLPADHPLFTLPNVILTPHVAYYSESSLAALGRLAAENVAAVLGGRIPPHVVNPEVLGRTATSGA